MTKNLENNENIAKIEIRGFYDLCNRLKELENENKSLKARNLALAKRCNKLAAENDKYHNMSLWEFADTLSDEALAKAGHDLAADLLGGA